MSAADFPLIGAAATRAPEAARVLRTLPTETKDAALTAMAEALLERADEVLAANAADVDTAAADETPASLLARCLQHEVDHLDGKLFVDRLTGEARKRVLRALRS